MFRPWPAPTTVFDLERRIYRVDRLRLNPGGVPVRGVIYLLLIILAALITARLPLLGWAARARSAKKAAATRKRRSH